MFFSKLYKKFSKYILFLVLLKHFIPVCIRFKTETEQ